MFKLVILLAIAGAATARPGSVSPIYSAVVAEKTVESHGNAVVHNSVPVVETYSAPVLYASPPLLAEKTVTGYGHSLVHHTPVYQHAAYVAPTYYL